MKKYRLLPLICFLILIPLSACTLGGSQSLQNTQIALGIQSTQLALQVTQAAQQQAAPATSAPPVVEAPPVEPPAVEQPTYTPYPTYTVPIPTATEEQSYTAMPAFELFEDWVKNSQILLYDSMYRYTDSGNMIMKALDGLSLGRNTTNVKDAMGHYLSNLNSGTEWDLIIMGGEAHDLISGDFFSAFADQMDRGASIIMELWYIDEVTFGKIEPLMQRCGIAFQRDWQRPWNADLNGYLVYLLEPSNPIFSNPNTISMLIPTSAFWFSGDVGDHVKQVPGSNATILAGSYPREYNAYGLITECMDGRMIWQTFDTHDYKYNDMISLWQNYIINTLQARYEYVQ